MINLDSRHHEAVMNALIEGGPRAFDGNAVCLKYKIANADAFAPRYATAGSACFDLFAANDDQIYHGESRNFDTGIAFEIPPTHVMLVFSRSGMGVKKQIRLSNSVGVIDSDYRGTVSVSLHNDGTVKQTIKAGDRIAQAMLVPIPFAALVQVDELSPTVRGAGGLGSTGN